MKAKQLIDALRSQLTQELQAKTGWGRNEVLQVFERAVAAILGELVPLADRLKPEVVLELPDGDTREAKVHWSEYRGNQLYLCITVEPRTEPVIRQPTVIAQCRKGGFCE